MLFLEHHLWQLMLLMLAIMLFSGMPVAVVLTGLGLGFGVIGAGFDLVHWQDFGLIYYRVFGSLFDLDDIFWSAVPLLLFMGLVMHHSGLAGEMLNCLQKLFRRIPAGLAIASLFLGALLAPAAGMVGASVVTLSLITLPTMLQRAYRPALASGVVAASGTLGVAFPPGVMLVFVAQAMGVHVTYIFLAMLGPSLLLMFLYGGYCILAALRNPSIAPSATDTGPEVTLGMFMRGLLFPAALIAAMILAVTVGYLPIAEAAAVGATCMLMLSILTGRFNQGMLRRSVLKTALISGMIFFIFIGATIFNLTFRLIGGLDAIAGLLIHLRLGSWGILAVILFTLFCLGFFIDWIELVMVSFVIFRPALDSLDFSGLIGSPILAYSWITVLITMTLQISFLTPPFGYALFSLEGSAPPSIRMQDIYRGVAPFVILSLLAIGCVAEFPSLATWLPARVLSLDVPRKVNVHEAKRDEPGWPDQTRASRPTLRVCMEAEVTDAAIWETIAADNPILSARNRFIIPDLARQAAQVQQQYKKQVAENIAASKTGSPINEVNQHFLK